MNINLNKNQKVMAAIGGVAAVVVLACGWLGYSASRTRSEAQQKLDAAKGQFDTNNKASAAQKAQIAENTTAFKDWGAEKIEAVQKMGDGVPADMVNASQETFARDVQSVYDRYRQSIYTGQAEGSDMPKPFDGLHKCAKEDLPVCKRQWCDIKRIVDTLIAAKAEKLSEIKIDTPARVEEVVDDRKNKKKKDKTPEVKDHFSRQNYSFTFEATPEALVEVMNKIETGTPFQTIDALELKLVTTGDGSDDALKALLTKRKMLAEKKLKPTGPATTSDDDAEEGAGAEQTVMQEDSKAMQEAERERWASKPGNKKRNPPFAVTMKVTTHVVEVAE